MDSRTARELRASGGQARATHASSTAVLDGFDIPSEQPTHIYTLTFSRKLLVKRLP